MSSVSHLSTFERLKSDLQPDADRWRFAARVAISGLLIISVQMTLRFEILYPGMSAMLIISEQRGVGTVTRFVINIFAATFGCACAVAVGALFIQQPWFLLPTMWAYIVGVIYFMGSSAYRSAFFLAGYPFIVIMFMMFFGKEDAEQTALMVYKSVAVGVCCVSLVTIMLWPSDPLRTLEANILSGFRRTRMLLLHVIDQIRAGENAKSSAPLPDSDRANAVANIRALGTAKTDHSMPEEERRGLLAVINFERRCSVCVRLSSERVGDLPKELQQVAIEGLSALDQSLQRSINAIEGEFGDESADSRPKSAPTQIAADHDLAPHLEWINSVISLRNEADEIASEKSAISTLRRRRNVVAEVFGNLGASGSQLFRLPIFPPRTPELKHAAKCATSILICALVCITLNWSTGIGCVETVMLVVQLTFGATLMIGGLRFFGVIAGYTLAILAIIFIMPTITTLPGLLLLFAPVLFAAAYGMHGVPRVSTPAIQVMIVFDFALLQLTRPDISLFPAMDFALAVSMGIGVTFVVYRFLWPTRALDGLAPCLAEMFLTTSKVLRECCEKPLQPAAIDAAQLELDDQFSKYIALHQVAQYELKPLVRTTELRGRAGHLTNSLCTAILQRCLLDSASRVVPVLNAAQMRLLAGELERCAQLVLRGGSGVPPERLERSLSPNPQNQFVQSSTEAIEALRTVLKEFAAAEAEDSPPTSAVRSDPIPIA